jgi:hypothetical protein
LAAEDRSKGGALFGFVVLFMCIIGICGTINTLELRQNTMTKEDVVPIVLIERENGTTYVYSRIGNVKDSSGVMYIADTNSIVLVRSYSVDSRNMEELKNTSNLRLKTK